MLYREKIAQDRDGGEMIMALRSLKAVFAAAIALLALFYASQNVANLDACYQAFAYVFSREDHVVYPASFFPTVTHPVLIWGALILVVGLEFLTGLLAARGAWDLWAARRAPANTFNGAKTYALLGCGVGMVVWLGLFAVFGGALFQMWQTEVGANSLEGAFQFFGACALVYLVIAQPDD
jgi:predicted small integral membrane protein